MFLRFHLAKDLNVIDTIVQQNCVFLDLVLRMIVNKTWFVESFQ